MCRVATAEDDSALDELDDPREHDDDDDHDGGERVTDPQVEPESELEAELDPDEREVAAHALLATGAVDPYAPVLDTTERARDGGRHARWGRLDLAIAYRRHWTHTWSARAALSKHDDQLWLVATWRR